MQVTREADWRGYVGSPRLATRESGERIWKALSASAIAVTSKILDGEDVSAIKRYGDLLANVPAYMQVDEGARTAESGVARKQAEWLKSKRIE
jgi:hypothetical protein